MHVSWTAKEPDVEGVTYRADLPVERSMSVDSGGAGLGLAQPRPGRRPTLPSIAKARPDLAAQAHPRRNGRLSPESTSIGISRRVWWLCPVAPDHEWEASPANRIHGGTGCPF